MAQDTCKDLFGVSYARLRPPMRSEKRTITTVMGSRIHQNRAESLVIVCTTGWTILTVCKVDDCRSCVSVSTGEQYFGTHYPRRVSPFGLLRGQIVNYITTDNSHHLLYKTPPTTGTNTQEPHKSTAPNLIMSAGKIAVYSVPDLKNTTDDAVPNYLTSLKFTPNYQIQDVKLALGYTAVAISAALFYADWKLGWDQTKVYTLPAVVVYFLLNGIFTYWIFYVEKGAVFVGEKGDTKVCFVLCYDPIPETLYATIIFLDHLMYAHSNKTFQITVSTHAAKFDPTYQVTVTTASKKSPSKTSTLKISAPFSRWFTSDGLFTVKPFQQFLASSVPEIGKADPKNVVEEIGRGSEAAKASATSRSVQISANDMDAVLRQL